jgi:hypothetical protein
VKNDWLWMLGVALLGVAIGLAFWQLLGGPWL